MGLTLAKNYKYSGYSTSTNYRGIATWNGELAIAGNSNKYFHTGSATANSVTLSSVTAPFTSTNTFGDLDYRSATELVFTMLEPDTSGGENTSASFYHTTDHSSFTQHKLKYGYVHGADGVGSPLGGIASATLPKICIYSNNLFVSPTLNGVIPPIAVYGYGDKYSYRWNGGTVTTVTEDIGLQLTNQKSYSNNIENITANTISAFYTIDNNALIKTTIVGTITTVMTSTYNLQACTKYSTSIIAIGDNGATYSVTSAGTVTDISFTATISVTDCSINSSGQLAIVGKSGKIYVKSGATILTTTEASTKDLNAIEYDSSRGRFIVAGNGIVFDLDIIANETLQGQLLSKGISSNTLAGQLYVALFNSDTLASQLLTKGLTSENLASQLTVIQKYSIPATLSMQLLVAQVPSDDYSIKFMNETFADLGIYVSNWKDVFEKDIRTTDDNTKQGFSINRYEYYGLNSIEISGQILTSTIDDVSDILRNKSSYGYGKLYKRANFYTNAELKEFKIGNSLNGYKYPCTMRFVSDRPYYYFDQLNEVSNSVTFSSTVTPYLKANVLSMINDDIDIVFEGSVPYGTRYISAGYKLTGKTNDTSPSTTELSVNGLNSVTYMDAPSNSTGVIFPRKTFVKRFYLNSSGLADNWQVNIFDVFDIWFKNENNNWEKYNLPFNVWIEKIPYYGYSVIFDELFLNTYEFKINCITTGGNHLNISTVPYKLRAIIIPDYYSSLTLKGTDTVTSEMRIDTKNNVVYKDGDKYIPTGQLLRLYPKTTYFWVIDTVSGGALNLKLIYDYQTLYFPV